MSLKSKPCWSNASEVSIIRNDYKYCFQLHVISHCSVTVGVTSNAVIFFVFCESYLKRPRNALPLPFSKKLWNHKTITCRSHVQIWHHLESEINKVSQYDIQGSKEFSSICGCEQCSKFRYVKRLSRRNNAVVGLKLKNNMNAIY